MQKIAISRFGAPEVRVRSHTIGVGWSDVLVRTGAYPWLHLFPMPAIPGVEMASTAADRAHLLRP